MTDEQRPAGQGQDECAPCSGTGEVVVSWREEDGDHSEYITCPFCVERYEPNPDAPLSEIVRQPATKRERDLAEQWEMAAMSEGGITYLGCDIEYYPTEHSQPWLLRQHNGAKGDFGTFTDALAHAEQLAEGRE